MLTKEINQHIAYNYKLYLKRKYPNQNIQPWHNGACAFIHYLNDKELLYSCLDKSIVKQYITYLQEQKYSINYINSLLNGLRKFYKYLFENKFIKKDKYLDCYSVQKIERPHQTKKEELFTIRDLNILINRMMLYSHIGNPYKIKTILYFMFYTGIINQELIKLKRSDIDLEKCSADIKETSRLMPRTVYFPEVVKTLLKLYFNSEKEVTNAFNITSKVMGSIGTQLGKYKVLSKKFSFTLLRHSYIRMLAKNKIDILVVRRLAGFKTIESASYYYEPTELEVENIYKTKITTSRRVR